MRLRFVTTNQGKLDFLRIVLAPAVAKGLVDSVEMCPVELMEVQADSFAEICRQKTQEAYRRLGGNVVVQDSGFAIEELNGFPGPYTKYVLSTIGVNGILKLMEGKQNRRCGFMACVGYADAQGDVHIFEEPTPYYGTLKESRASQEADGAEGQEIGRAWGDEAGKLFEVFVPDDLGCAATATGLSLAEMSEVQLTEYRRVRRSAFRRFAEWLQGADGAGARDG